KGSVVSYAPEVKTRILGVPETVLKVHGEVSRPTARHMAQGARRVLRCDWSLSITGIAGPSGGSADKPVGTVCFAVSGPGFEESWLHNFDSQLTREDIQRQAAIFALDLLRIAIK